jgi:hypothetical protein
MCPKIWLETASGAALFLRRYQGMTRCAHAVSRTSEEPFEGAPPSQP